MTADATDDVLTAECRVRFMRLCVANVNSEPPVGMDLYVEGFWAGVEAIRQPRNLLDLQTEEALARARAAGLIK